MLFKSDCSMIYLLLLMKNVVQAQDCSDVVEKYRSATVALKVTRQNKVTGSIAETYGSGVVVHKRGNVLTSFHVVGPAVDSTKEAVTIEGTVGTAANDALPRLFRLSDEEPKHDLALLVADNSQHDWTPAAIGDSDSVKTGSGLCSNGFPVFVSDTHSTMRIEFLGGVPGTLTSSERAELWKSTIPSNPGESGAPVFTQQGHVVALKYGAIKKADGISVLTPIRFANKMLSNLSLPGGESANNCLEFGVNVAGLPPKKRALVERACTANIDSITQWFAALFNINPKGLSRRELIQKLQAEIQSASQRRLKRVEKVMGVE